MIALAAGTAAAAAHSKMLFAGSSGKFNLASKSGVSMSTRKEISTLQLMLTVLIAIDMEAGDKEMKETLKRKDSRIKGRFAGLLD